MNEEVLSPGGPMTRVNYPELSYYDTLRVLEFFYNVIDWLLGFIYHDIFQDRLEYFIDI